MTRTPIQFPPSVTAAQRWELLRPTHTRLWAMDGGWINGYPTGGTKYRRFITRDDPWLFAVTYLGDDLRDDETGDMSFCDFHMDAYARARAWMEPAPQRDVVVAFRGGGKSTLYFRALPLWALAHGHHRFFCAFSRTGGQAAKHLRNILNIVHGRSPLSRLLLNDFPELRPVRGAGVEGITVLQGDGRGRRAIGAYGISESTLGLNVDGMRPSLLVGDDIQRGGNKWTPKEKAETLVALTENIFPMSGRRPPVIQVVGTVVARGCLIHDAVRAAQGSASRSWLQDAGFRAHWYPAIVDEGLSTVRSAWPQQWSLEELQRDRYNEDGQLNKAFALAKMNDPVKEESGAYWQSGFRYLRHRAAVTRWVCFVDPAKSTHDTSDWTAYVVAGRLTTQKPAVVVAVGEQGHWSYQEMRQRLGVLRDRYSGLQVYVEANALGSWENARDLFGLKCRRDGSLVGDGAPWAHASKEVRIRAAADVYAEDDLVRHARELRTLEDELTSYGQGNRDDLPDALAGALGVLLPGKIPA